MRLRRTLATGLLFLLALLLPQTALAKDYSITDVAVHAALSADGTLQVEDQRTFRFDGPYTHIWQTIGLPGKAEIADLQLTGPDGTFAASGSGQPGTYTLERQDEGIRLDWYFEAESTSVTFTLSYRVKHAVRVHRDSVELVWNPIGGQWERGTGRAAISLDLPSFPVDIWAEGPGAWHLDGARYTGDVVGLADQTALTVRALLPPSAITDAAVPPDGKTVHAVRARAGRERDLSSLALQAAWLAVALVLGTVFYVRHVRRPAVLAGDKAALPPAALALFTGHAMKEGLRATLIDLAVRGALQVESCGPKDWRFTWLDAPAVTPHEHEALTAFFPDGQRSITLTQWQAAQKRSGKGYTRLTRWWEHVRKTLPAAWFVPHQWYIYLPAAAGLIIAVATYPSALQVPGGLAAGALLLLGLVQCRYSEEGYRQLAGWRKERGYLARQGQLPAEAFARAIALGLNLKRLADPTELIRYDLEWMEPTFLILTASGFDGSSAGGFSGGGGGVGGGGGGAS